jgi:glycosyltransferase involved in cell wall biosynthesis
MPSHPAIKIVPMRNRWGSLAPIVVHQTGRPLLNRKFLETFFRQPFDVIHYNNISLLGGPQIYQYGSAVKLVTFHDYWAVCPMSTLYKYGKEICKKKNCVLCMLYTKKPPQWWRYTRLMSKSLKHIDAMISPSGLLKDFLQREGVEGNFYHIPNFVVPEEAKPDGGGRSPFPNSYFLFVGRLEKNKGVQNLIPVFQKGRYGSLLIAGDGYYRDELENIANGSPHIKFLGYLDQNDLKGYYQHARALIVPSIWYEIFGLVIIEAMRLGTPIIAHDIAGPGELVRCSKAGLVYQTTNELEANLVNLMSDTELQEKFSKNGVQYFNDNFTPEIHLSRYFSLIEDIRSQKI